MGQQVKNRKHWDDLAGSLCFNFCAERPSSEKATMNNLSQIKGFFLHIVVMFGARSMQENNG